jgi:hypothetical protein
MEKIILRKLNKASKNILNNDTFKHLYGKFKHNPNCKNYCKLTKYLKWESDRYLTISRYSSLLLTDDVGVVIFNSRLGNNTFCNYTNGNITFDNIYQQQATSQAEKQGSSLLSNTSTIATNMYLHVFYASIKYNSVLTMGTSTTDAIEEQNLGSGENDCVIM